MAATPKTQTPTARAGRRPIGVRSRVFALLLVTAFFTTAAMAHVWVRLQVVRLGYRISEETEREKTLLQLHRKLQVERAMLRRPERLEQLAKERLQLTLPNPDSIEQLKRRRRRAPRPVSVAASRRGL